jgi:LUD domain
MERVAAVLTANNIEAVIVQDGNEARQRVLERIPDGAEVRTARSKTIEDTGLHAELNESGRYDALRPRYLMMDRATQVARSAS